MAQVPPALFKLWGFNTQGDWGPFTFYTNKRNALVFYLRAPPKKPWSPIQLAQQAKFADAAHAWTALPPAAKANWERATHLAHLRITGYDLWMYWTLRYDDQAIRTIERQTGITLLPA